MAAMAMTDGDLGVLIDVALARRLYSLMRSYIADLEHRGWAVHRERDLANQLMDAINVAEAGQP